MADSDQESDRNVLEQEYAFYLRMKPEWLKTHSGRVVVIKGESVLGWYDNEVDGFKAGVQKLRAEAFLVKRVVESEPKFEAPAFTLGIMRAAV
jgi:hypothetical protein